MPWMPPQRTQTSCKRPQGDECESTLNIAIRSPNQHVTVGSLCGALWAFVVNPTLV